jgi:hypothetical protein
MTIVVAVLTTDGLVLASDSATTQSVVGSNGDLRTSSIWNSADKIVNLRRSWPIGAMTFGRATFQGRSIATHAKDLRSSLSGPSGDANELDESSYTVGDVANAVRAHFRPLYDAEPGGGVLGFLVGGVGAVEQSPEVWQVLVGENEDEVTQMLPPGESGILHQGMTDALTRLIDGAGQGLGAALVKLGVPQAQSEPAAESIRAMLSVPWAWSGMPLGETIDLARFLVDTTINFVRFSPGDAMVGGPVEIAAITKHEGFKWVQRKHYYPAELNPTKDVNRWS